MQSDALIKNENLTDKHCEPVDQVTLPDIKSDAIEEMTQESKEDSKEESKRMVLSINNIRDDQIQNLVKLDIISQEQAQNAMGRPTIAQIIYNKTQMKKIVIRKRNKSVYTGPLRQKISPKRHYLPSAWGLVPDCRQNP